MENKLKNLKFRVHSEAHSKAIQEKLFSMDEGIKWNVDSNQKLLHLNKPYLYLKEKNLTYNTCGSYFNKKKDTLCTLDDLYKMEAEINFEILKEIESLKKRLQELESKLK